MQLNVNPCRRIKLKDTHTANVLTTCFGIIEQVNQRLTCHYTGMYTGGHIGVAIHATFLFARKTELFGNFLFKWDPCGHLRAGRNAGYPCRFSDDAGGKGVSRDNRRKQGDNNLHLLLAVVRVVGGGVCVFGTSMSSPPCHLRHLLTVSLLTLHSIPLCIIIPRLIVNKY